MTVVEGQVKAVRAGGEVPVLVRRGTPVAVGVSVCALLAVVQVVFAGYQLGVGNQSIQIAFLQHAADPSLFSRDVMVRETLPTYSTYFFWLLAPLLKWSALEPLYLGLHILFTFLTLAGVYLLGRQVTHSHFSAMAAVAMLVAGHHRALAGDTLYSAGFTHTYAVLGPAIFAMALLYGRRNVAAFALAGLLLNVHALTGAYLLVMMGMALLADLPEMKFAAWVKRGLLCVGAAILMGLPTLVSVATHRQVFDGAWLNLMHVRSADHSFPTQWWATGDPDVPRFAMIFALFVLSLSFPVLSRSMRVTRWMVGGTLGLFVAGYVFTEIWPSAFVIRLQPFRASRLLMVLMFVHIAHASAQGIRMLVHRRMMKPWVRTLEALSGVLVLGALVEPTLLPAMPLAVFVTAGVALVTGRLSWLQATLSTGALFVVLVAHWQLHFPLPVLSREVSLLPGTWSWDVMLWVPLVLAGVLAVGGRWLWRPWPQACGIAAAMLISAVGFWQVFERQLNLGEGDLLIAAQRKIAELTPRDAVVLAPANTPNTRIYAQRAIVPNWRDGTQLYFAAGFAKTWWDSMSSTEPGILLSPDNARLISRGKSLATLEDEALMELARRRGATHLLLPTDGNRMLEAVYQNAKWSVYVPRISAAATANVPEGTVNAAEWLKAERFYTQTVLPNIEKHRKADVSIQVLDSTGRPVQDLELTLTQKRHAFLLGASLSFFEPNSTNSLGDQKPAPVTAQELELFPQLFSASMIPFSSKWMYIEPTSGKRDFSDLDKYVAYANARNIELEFHYLAGLTPQFLRKDPAEHAKRYPDHARELLARYHDKIRFWQVTNDKVILDQTPALFKEFREQYPHVKLGISDCTRFYSNKTGEARSRELLKGYDGLLYLKKQGITPDFFSIHGHYPVGCWTDPRDMYEVLDTYAKEGVKVHVTEMLLPLNSAITGSLRKGKWTDELQAEFLQRYLAVCFSHPSVEMLNLWGLVGQGWGASSGLLDGDLRPRKAFLALQELWTRKWNTSVREALPLDGTVRVRAFHGEYRMTVRMGDGRVVSTSLTVPEKRSHGVRFELDTEAGELRELRVGVEGG